MTSNTIRLLAANAVILACLAAGSVNAEQSVTRPPSGSPSIDYLSLTKPWTGDLDGMITGRQIRVLLPYSKTHYFIDKGVQRGVTYDALKQFENELNTRLKTGTLRVHVVFLPTPLDKLQAALLEGRGDVAVANVTRTADWEHVAEFVAPRRAQRIPPNWQSSIR
jgi:hypothetical protein